MILLTQNKILASRVFFLKNNRDRNLLYRFGEKIREYQNSILDRAVLDEDYDFTDRETERRIWVHLFNLNLIPLTQYFRTVTHNNTLSFDGLTRLRDYKYQTCENITKEQAVLFRRNLGHVEEILNTHNIDKNKYAQLKGENPAIKRSELLRLASEKGINTDHLSNVWSIRDPDILSRNLYREAQMDAEYKSAFINPEMQYKMWVWSEADNTRHSNMDGDTVELEEKFEVLNEVTGETDMMMYPHDPDGSPGNVINCLCDVMYMEKLPIELSL